MIFKKQREPMCAYCLHGRLMMGGRDVLCALKGVVSADYRCRKFNYDPVSRQVKRRRLPDAKGLDFSID